MTSRQLTRLALASIVSTALWAPATPTAYVDSPANPDTPQPTASTALNHALKAHGGLPTWRSFKRMDYATSDFPLGANAPFNFTQTTDLQHRRHHTKGDGFTAGKNEHRAWAHPSVDALGIPPAFFEEGNFYFIAMPFVFADPGVVARDLKHTTFNGKQYDRVAISYQNNIGDTPEDDYILYIEKDTRLLRMIDFVPTSAEINGDTPKDQLPRKALVFDNWQKANGLLIPGKATFYGWADGQRQGDGNTYTVHDVSFSKTAPNPTLFKQPRRTAHAE